MSNSLHHRPTKRTGPRRRRRTVAFGVSVGVLAGLFGSAGPSMVFAAPGATSPAQAAPAISVGLHQGQAGPQVKALQEALLRSGVSLPGGADGVYGPGTKAAVASFQSARGLPATGEVDSATLAALSPAAAPAASAGAGDLALGAQSDAVKALQQALIASGVFLPGGADGVFGAATQTGVKHFQRWNGLEVTGIANAATMAKLGAAAAAPAVAAPAAAPAAAPNPSVGLKMGAQGALVKSLQTALINSGISILGGADGSFGAATKAALTSYQSANGLTASGTVDDATAAKLALGAAAAPAAPAATGNPYVGLKAGAQGDVVKHLQRALIQTGLALRGGADGSFGAATQTVLTTFQKTNGTPQTGVVGEQDASILGLTTSGPTGPQGISSGSGFPVFGEHGDRVKAMQQSLVATGISVPGGADGVFGASTAGAIMAFQRRESLPVTGKVDDQTAARLGQAAAPAPVPPSASGIALQAFPVQGQCWFGDTWQAPRGGGRLHQGLDVIAAQGKELYAVVDGKIGKQYIDSPGSLSGNGLRVTMPNGTYFTYLHLSAFAPGMELGVPVKAGQLIGYVGMTGNAAGPHLHFEVHPAAGGAVNPYPLVKAVDACSNTASRA